MQQPHTETARTALNALAALTLNNHIPTEAAGRLHKAISLLDNELHDAHTQVARTLAMCDMRKEWDEGLPTAYEGCGLTPTERELLRILHLAKGRPLSKQLIYDSVYPVGNGPEIKIVDIFVCKIRARLAEHRDRIESQGHSAFIATLWGFGYRLVPLDECKGKASPFSAKTGRYFRDVHHTETLANIRAACGPKAA